MGHLGGGSIEGSLWLRRPSDKKVIACKKLSNIKEKYDRTIDRYKARVIAKGYNQQESIDYDKTFIQLSRWPQDSQNTCPEVSYWYIRDPFGLKNAGATYQRAMTALFHDMIHKKMKVYVYVDDMIVKSWAEEDL